jgi:Ca2+-binding EF-hand superfamily protein
MKKLFCALLAVAVAFGTSGLMAAPEKPKEKKSPEDQFKQMDKNGDGKVSLEEFLGKREGEKKAAAEKQFAAKDADKDGSLSLEEFKAPAKKKKDA